MRRVPKLKFDKCVGQYLVRWMKHRKPFFEYFGTDEKEAELQYAAWKVEWVQASVAGKVRQAADTTGFHVAAGLSPDISEEMSLGELGSKYTAWAQRNHTKNEAKNKRLFVEHVLNHVGDIYWSEFGTAQYMQLQEALIAEGRTRRRINVICSGVRTWLKWCYLQNLIGRQLHHDFKDVPHVRRDQGGVKESRKIKGIHWDKVQPVLDYMSPVVAAMVTVQFWSGMRPGEVCAMRFGELKFDDPDAWMYLPEAHKNSWRDHDLIKGIGRIGQQAMSPFLDRCEDDDDYVFRPIYAMEWRAYLAEEASSREDRACKVFPSEVKAREHRKQTRRAIWQDTLCPCYGANSYGQAVTYAFEKAERQNVSLEVWSPGRLRHGIATMLRQAGRMQDAKTLLGHKHISTTEIYAPQTMVEIANVVKDLETLNVA